MTTIAFTVTKLKEGGIAKKPSQQRGSRLPATEGTIACSMFPMALDDDDDKISDHEKI